MESSLVSSSYRREQKKIEFHAKIWKKIHPSPKEYTNFLPRVSSKEKQSTQPKRCLETDTTPSGSRRAKFCNSFLGLPGEVRNQIYDELLRRRANYGQTPLFRANLVTKRSHGGAAFAGPSWLPINSFTSLRYIGQNPQIWDELFGRWASQVRFYIVEAFEIVTNTSTFKNRLLHRKETPDSLKLARFIDPNISRVFEFSNSWFPLMRSCDLKLHIFGIEAAKLSEDGNATRLEACMDEIVRVTSHAKELVDLRIELWFWPDNYQERAVWDLWSSPPLAQVFTDAIEPLKQIKGISLIELHAGSVLEGSWDAQNPDIFEDVQSSR